MNINILALDQARNGAWSVFNYETKELIDRGTFGFNSKKYTYAQAIMNIEDIVSTLLKTYDISVAFIEDIQLRVNVHSFKRLAQLQGVLVNLFERNKYLYGYVAPTQWQSYCYGKASKNISKELSIQFVKDHFDIETENDNLADAVCIGWYVVNNVNIDLKKNKVTIRKK